MLLPLDLRLCIPAEPASLLYRTYLHSFNHTSVEIPASSLLNLFDGPESTPDWVLSRRKPVQDGADSTLPRLGRQSKERRFMNIADDNVILKGAVYFG